MQGHYGYVMQASSVTLRRNTALNFRKTRSRAAGSQRARRGSDAGVREAIPPGAGFGAGPQGMRETNRVLVRDASIHVPRGRWLREFEAR